MRRAAALAAVLVPLTLAGDALAQPSGAGGEPRTGTSPVSQSGGAPGGKARAGKVAGCAVPRGAAVRRRCARPLAAGARGAGRPVVFRQVARPPTPVTPPPVPELPAEVASLPAVAAAADAVAPGAAPDVPATAPPPAPAAPARLQATAREYSLALSRPTVAAGALVLQLVNRGEDPHDLRLVPTGKARSSAKPAVVPETLPGGVAEWRGKLTRGQWTLYCSLPGHKKAGMRATLTVS